PGGYSRQCSESRSATRAAYPESDALPRPVCPRSEGVRSAHWMPELPLPILRQLSDPTGRGRAARSRRSRKLKPRTHDADKVVESVCPYCAVGCGQLLYVKDGELTQIEGDPNSPISRGRLCPK